MTYLIILTESLELYHATKQLLDSSKVVLRQARHLDDLAKSILKHPIHMVILDELASVNLKKLNKVSIRLGLDHLPYIILHHGIKEAEYYYKKGALNVISVENHVSVLPSLVGNYLRHLDLRLRAKVFKASMGRELSGTDQEKTDIGRLPHLIKQYIFSESLSIEFLAQKLEISRRHLLRKIHEIHGVSAISYINDIKMGICHEMLLDGKHSIDEICELLGFKSPYYFRKKYEQYLKNMVDKPITKKKSHM